MKQAIKHFYSQQQPHSGAAEVVDDRRNPVAQERVHQTKEHHAANSPSHPLACTAADAQDFKRMFDQNINALVQLAVEKLPCKRPETDLLPVSLGTAWKRSRTSFPGNHDAGKSA